MIETIDNAIQLMLTAISACIAGYRAIKIRNRAWILCALVSGSYFLGDFYWQLYLMFYGHTPHYSWIPVLGWRASAIFMLLLLLETRGERKHPAPVKKVLFITPVFTISMSTYYAFFDGILENLVIAIIMTTLIWNCVDCLIDIRRGDCANPRCKWLCLVILLYCAMEYTTWTISCNWLGDTLENPYFWFEIVLALAFLLFLPATGKAVNP